MDFKNKGSQCVSFPKTHISGGGTYLKFIHSKLQPWSALIKSICLVSVFLGKITVGCGNLAIHTAEMKELEANNSNCMSRKR